MIDALNRYQSAVHVAFEKVFAHGAVLTVAELAHIDACRKAADEEHEQNARNTAHPGALGDR